MRQVELIRGDKKLVITLRDKEFQFTLWYGHEIVAIEFRQFSCQSHFVDRVHGLLS